MQLKNKRGSITIGIIILITVMLSLAVFGNEVFLMYYIKGNVERHVKNASSTSMIYAIDDSALLAGNLYIDPLKANLKANEVISANNNINDLMNVIDISIDIINVNEKQILNLIINGNIKKNFIFFKDMEIRANGITQIHFIDEINLETMTLYDLHNNIAFEVI